MYKPWNKLDLLSSVTCPVYTQMAFLDQYGQGGFALQDYLALGNAPGRKVYIGTGGHGTPYTDLSYISGSRDRWLDYWLKGEENGIVDEPPVTFGLLNTDDPTGMAPEHFSFDRFPHIFERRSTWYLGDENDLLQSPPDTSQTTDTFQNVTRGYTIDKAYADEFMPDTLMAKIRQETVYYATPPFDDRMLVVGFPSVRLWVDGTASHYQVNVHLIDEDRGGNGQLLSYATYLVKKADHPDGALLDLEMSLTGRRIHRGHRLCLKLTNLDVQVIGDDPEAPILRYLPYFEDNVTTVYHDALRPSSISVPILQEPSEGAVWILY